MAANAGLRDEKKINWSPLVKPDVIDTVKPKELATAGAVWNTDTGAAPGRYNDDASEDEDCTWLHTVVSHFDESESQSFWMQSATVWLLKKSHDGSE